MKVSYGDIAKFLFYEAWCLDTKRWENWLTLYADDAIYWAPAMVGDEEWTDDPDRDVSLMYINKVGLEARIFRIEGKDSYATDPLPHTAHLVNNVLVQGETDGLIRVSATWLVHSYGRARDSVIRGGLYEYELRDAEHCLRIVRKKIFIHDDQIAGPIDVYNV
jgi:3-phenylpropionate/cinnamic acid dioxygenase small subunit